MTEHNPRDRVTGGWNIWRGGECPCGPDELIDVRFRSGGLCRAHAARTWYWLQNGGLGDIVAWRPAKEEASQAGQRIDASKQAADKSLMPDDMALLHDTSRYTWIDGEGQMHTYSPSRAAWISKKQVLPIDPAAIKPGDRVAVWGRMDGTPAVAEGTYAFVTLGEGVHASTVRVSVADIALHEPKPEEPIKVGDIVRMTSHGSRSVAGDVVAVDGDKAWVRWNSKDLLHSLADLTRI